MHRLIVLCMIASVSCGMEKTNLGNMSVVGQEYPCLRPHKPRQDQSLLYPPTSRRHFSDAEQRPVYVGQPCVPFEGQAFLVDSSRIGRRSIPMPGTLAYLDYCARQDRVDFTRRKKEMQIADYRGSIFPILQEVPKRSRRKKN